MNILAATILTLSLLPTAALKAPAVPAPGPAPAAPAAPRLPLEQRARYELFNQKCSRCHAPDRALESGFSPQAWDAYLKRKYRRAGTGITPEQFAEIGAFLRYWSSQPR